MGVDMSYIGEDSTHAAQGPDAYKATPSSTPWGVSNGGDAISPVGVPANTEGGFYDERDDMVGGADTPYNVVANAAQQSGANWYSAGDDSPVFNSASGLGGERTAFGGTLSQDSLAGGGNPDTQYGH